MPAVFRDMLAPSRAHREDEMIRLLLSAPPLILLIVATLLEVSGDAVARMALYHHGGMLRVLLFVAAAALLLGYGLFLNLAPIEFGRVVGLYIATLFVVWQIITFVAFRAAPTLPMMLGGALIVAGGLITTFWKPA